MKWGNFQPPPTLIHLLSTFLITVLLILDICIYPRGNLQKKQTTKKTSKKKPHTPTNKQKPEDKETPSKAVPSIQALQ